MPTVERYTEWLFERDGQWWVFTQTGSRGPFATKGEALECKNKEKYMDEQLGVVGNEGFGQNAEVQAEVVETPKKARKPRAKKEAAPSALATEPALEEKVSEREAKARAALASIAAWEIDTQDAMELAGKIEAQAVAERKELEAQLKEITGPMRAAEKKVRDLFRPAIGYYEQIEEALKGKVRHFRLAAAAAQDAALKAIAESGGKADASTLAIAHGAEVLALPSNLREKVYHTWKCINFEEVPAAYKRYVLDEAMISAVVNRDGMQAQIPGVVVERQVDIHNKATRK